MTAPSPYTSAPSIDEALRNRLLQVAPLVAMRAGRIYAQVVPSGTPKPYQVLSRISSPGHHHLRGPAAIASPRFQLDSYGTSSVEARAMSEASRLVLDGFRGDMGAVPVRGIHLEDERDVPEPLGDGSEEVHYRTIQDYVVWHGR